MKVVLLAGGEGTRLAEETTTKPKPMVEIGNQPILWHIMKHYAAHDFRDFTICLGYKGEHIKRYFADFFALASDMTVHTGSGRVEYHRTQQEEWDVDLVNTGVTTETGGRMLRVAHLLDGRFMMTFGDGVSDVDIRPAPELSRESRRASPPSPRCGRRRASAHVELDGEQSSGPSPRSPRPARAGSTAASSCWNPRSSTTSTTT